MIKYRQKPIVIEAIKWEGQHITNMLERFSKPLIDNGCRRVRDNLVIRTLEGAIEAQLGDFVIKGIKGELSCCKPEIFEATYEAIE